MTIEEAVLHKLPDALAMQETIYSLKYIERKIKTNYNTTNVDKFLDINLIKQGFDAYKSNQFDELYFKVWCKLVSKIYKIKYDQIHNWMDESEFDRKQVAYKIIAKLVRNAPDSTNLNQVIAEIVYHDAVLVGKEPCNYPLVQDFEFFECFGDSDYYRDVLQINHFQKTYFYTDCIEEFWEENFKMDFDDYYERLNAEMHTINAATFNMLKDALKQAGYRETDNFFMIENACNLYE